MKNPVYDPAAGTSNELDVQNEWEENTLTHTHRIISLDIIYVEEKESIGGQILCVCVCFLPIHSGHQVRWTYQPGSHRRKVTQDF